MAFFDEGDEPRTRVTRPRRPAGGGGGGSRSAGGPGPDPATVRQRRLIFAVVAVLFVILMAVLINGCLDNRAKNRLKDYNRDVANVVAQSDREVSKPFFDLMSQSGQSPVELESQINQLRVTADKQVDTAQGFDVPDELKTAQRNLLLALDMRASALGKIAGEIRTALASGDQSEQATTQIAAQMQQFLASDVVYDARVIPYIQQTLNEKEIGGQTQQDSQFLPNLDWLQPSFVADKLGASAGGGGGTANRPVAPGLHGHGLTSTSVGDVTLQPGQTNRIPAGSNVVFTVKFANQGENDETDVPVTVRINGTGVKAITAKKTVPQTKAGTETTVTIPLTSAPPIGTPVTINVQVGKVPGEQKTDNNKSSYPAIFTR